MILMYPDVRCKDGMFQKIWAIQLFNSTDMRKSINENWILELDLTQYHHLEVVWKKGRENVENFLAKREFWKEFLSS